jgi:predicted nucleic acid binding AN1-type Zn finger protein
MHDDSDLHAIGAHCHYTYCNQLDFLPFRCPSCTYTYCLEHRTETAHECPKAGAWAATRRAANNSSNSSSNTASSNLSAQKPTLATATQCSDPTCKTYINTLNAVGVHCDACNRSYCLKHRLREEHRCAQLVPLGARPTAASQVQRAGQTALARLRAWGREKAATSGASGPGKKSGAASKQSSAAARVVAANALKKTAKGDVKIPADKRVYLHVEAEAATTRSKLPRGEFFYSGEWSVGRMLDEAAKGLQVENVNNRGGGEELKLRVFHVEGGRLLEFGEKVGKALVSGNTVVLLRGVGPAVPDLIEL